MSSCSENNSNGGSLLHKLWDWFTGKPSKAQQKEMEKAKKLSKDLENPSASLANVNIKALPKAEKKCFKIASEYSGVPLIIMYTFTLGESTFNPSAVNKNHSPVKWDCGITQDNVLENVCPLAYRYTIGIGKWHPILVSRHPKLFKAIQELGLKYVGGGYDDLGNCSHDGIPDITHEQAKEYCSEVGTAYTTSVTPSNPTCLGIMIGAYIMAKDYCMFKHNIGGYRYDAEYYARKSGVEQQALANAGKYADWIYVAYIYNGLSSCNGFGCYFYTFSERIKNAVANGVHWFDRFF